MSYKVVVDLKERDIWEVETRVAELREIRDWIDQLVGWDSDSYQIQQLGSGLTIHVWFKDQKHAIMCALRWL